MFRFCVVSFLVPKVQRFCCNWHHLGRRGSGGQWVRSFQGFPPSSLVRLKAALSTSTSFSHRQSLLMPWPSGCPFSARQKCLMQSSQRSWKMLGGLGQWGAADIVWSLPLSHCVPGVGLSQKINRRVDNSPEREMERGP